MKTYYLILFACSLIFCHCKKHDSASLMNESDHNFLTMASHFNRSQIEISNLSCQKAEDNGVKQLAEELVKYHKRSQNEIDHIAFNNNAAISVQHSQKHVNMRNSLAQLSGKTFDSVYVCYQLKLNLTMMNLINDELHYGKNTMVKEYATRLNSEVIVHLNQSDSLSELFLSTYFRQDI